MRSPNRIVMVVDDDRSVRDALARLLRSAGLRPRMFDSAETFLNGPALATAGCMVIDVEMPGMRGLELQQICIGRRPRLPIIMISAFADEDSESRAMVAGARAFFHKPFDADSFVGEVKAAMGM
jgi:FixJ family two-component response regulator